MQYKRDLEKIRRWCIRRKLEGEGWKVTDICKHVHISQNEFLQILEQVQKRRIGWTKRSF